ncbi:MAG: hypothetical protein LUB83_03600, partial [Prevotellaceae bacterium]|nr:hypothetical protein [Prevotellaceae bacterium]
GIRQRRGHRGTFESLFHVVYLLLSVMDGIGILSGRLAGFPPFPVQGNKVTVFFRNPATFFPIYAEGLGKGDKHLLG